MNIQRANEILNNKEKCDVYYKEDLVWIQELNKNIATVGFVFGHGDKEVNVNDLYEPSI